MCLIFFTSTVATLQWYRIGIMTPQITDNYTVCSIRCLSNNNKNVNVLYYWPFVRRFHLWLLDYTQSVPVTWKALPCHNVKMNREFINTTIAINQWTLPFPCPQRYNISAILDGSLRCFSMIYRNVMNHDLTTEYEPRAKQLWMLCKYLYQNTYTDTTPFRVFVSDDMLRVRQG